MSDAKMIAVAESKTKVDAEDSMHLLTVCRLMHIRQIVSLYR
ncbi:MAG: hypothetical protein QGM45_10790 [Anaerolineales bacterium]|nr:hypothetical protein [Anaerolineales bacterium]